MAYVVGQFQTRHTGLLRGKAGYHFPSAVSTAIVHVKHCGLVYLATAAQPGGKVGQTAGGFFQHGLFVVTGNDNDYFHGENRFFKLCAFAKHKPHEQKVYGHGDGKHRERCPIGRQTHPQKEVEQHDVEQIVHNMGPTHAPQLAPRGTGAEGEPGSEVKVEKETDQIAQGVGQIDWQQGVECIVEAIMQCGG